MDEVEPAVAVDGGLHQLDVLLPRGDVGAVEGAADLARDLDPPDLVDVGDQHPRPGLRERPARGGTEPTGATGDDRDLAGESRLV